MKVTFFQRTALMLAVAVLAGCATGSSFVTETMSNKDYVSKSEAERAKYRQSVTDEAKAIEEKEWLEYLSGRPVYTGNADTGRTIQWDKRVKMVYVYPGHNPSGMGLETFGAVALVTDGVGEVKYDDKGYPLKVFVNVAVQEDLLRATLKTFAGAIPSAFNGAVAAKIQTDACKDGGCGTNIQLNQETVSVGMGGQGGSGGSAGALSLSGSSADANAGVSGNQPCVTCTGKLIK